MARIFFIHPYPKGTAASQRFRFEQFEEDLLAEGHELIWCPFWDEGTWSNLYASGSFIPKMWSVFKGSLRRLRLLGRINKGDFVFIHREAVPVGPAWFESIVRNILEARVIYDFDDAIWLKNSSSSNKGWTRLKSYRKIKRICGYAEKVIVGNRFLADYARQYNSSVHIIPTVVDADRYHNQLADHKKRPLVIGWTGSHSTLPYLEPLVPVIRELEKKHTFEFQVISDAAPAFDLERMKYVKWNANSEIEQLLQFNVGLMPLSDDDWSRGKCGFKAIQYLSLGIPALISPVGVNSEIVKHNDNGLLCATKEEWREALDSLLSNPSEIERLADKARSSIIGKFTRKGNSANFIHLFT